MVTGACLFQSFTTVLGAMFWIGSVHLNYPIRYIFIWTAIFIDLFAGTFGLWISKASRDKGSWVTPLARRWFDIYPACDIEHRTERTKAFVSLVFGYSVLTLLYQSSAEVGVNAHLGKGILGLLQAFAFQWLYFEIDNHDIDTHAIRRHWASSTTWAIVHLLFVLTYTLAAATQCKIVLAHDCPDSRLQDFGEVWQVDSMSELSRGLRWFYCGGVGIALFSMGLLSFCHIHKEITDARLKKTPRLAIRTCISVIIVCLPIAEKLNSLQLTSINTALVVLSLIIDLYGTSYTGDRFWTGGWDDDSKKDIEYTATLPLEPKASLRLDEDLHTRKRVIAEDRSSTEAV